MSTANRDRALRRIERELNIIVNASPHVMKEIARKASVDQWTSWRQLQHSIRTFWGAR